MSLVLHGLSRSVVAVWSWESAVEGRALELRDKLAALAWLRRVAAGAGAMAPLRRLAAQRLPLPSHPLDDSEVLDWLAGQIATGQLRLVARPLEVLASWGDRERDRAGRLQREARRHRADVDHDRAAGRGRSANPRRALPPRATRRLGARGAPRQPRYRARARDRAGWEWHCHVPRSRSRGLGAAEDDRRTLIGRPRSRERVARGRRSASVAHGKKPCLSACINGSLWPAGWLG